MGLIDPRFEATHEEEMANEDYTEGYDEGYQQGYDDAERSSNELIDMGEYKIEQLHRILTSVMEIVNNSHGVAGWHMNGDIAPWDEFEVEKWAAALEPSDE